jgi:cytochrome c553
MGSRLSFEIVAEGCERMHGELFMKNLSWILAFSFLSVGVATAQAPQLVNNGLPAWAYNVPDKVQPPPSAEEPGPLRMPGSAKTYTPKQADDGSNPPDWFPEEHGPVPDVVKGGTGKPVAACGSCHLMSGQGHPESADLAGLPVEYIVHQMAYFKNLARRDPARMNVISKVTSQEDARLAAEYFAAQKPRTWVKVVESEMAPKTYVSNRGRVRMALPGGGMEPTGNRIIELAEDSSRSLNRDPHSPFIAYVPVGSIAKGEALVKTAGAGKTIQCSICHGEGLKGLGDVPRVAGLQPVYIFRQLYDIKNGSSAGSAVALMKKVVANLNEDDMIAIAAYVGSLAP